MRDKELLERVQRRFTRMIPELKDFPCAERLGKSNLRTLEERRVRARGGTSYGVGGRPPHISMQWGETRPLPPLLSDGLTVWCS